jgi:hypothetical protein
MVNVNEIFHIQHLLTYTYAQSCVPSCSLKGVGGLELR